jgi:hypothetical protein
MRGSIAPSWHSRHARKIEIALFALTFLLVCNSLAAVLGYDAFFDPSRPRSALMASGGLFISHALNFWRVQSMLVIVILGFLSIGLLVTSSLTIS